MLVLTPTQDRGSIPLASKKEGARFMWHYGESVLSGEVIRLGKILQIMRDAAINSMLVSFSAHQQKVDSDGGCKKDAKEK